MQSKQYSIKKLINEIQFLPKIIFFHAISQIVIPTFLTFTGNVRFMYICLHSFTKMSLLIYFYLGYYSYILKQA